jgi:hypothetical protein
VSPTTYNRIRKGEKMHKMSKESATALAGLQSRLNKAEEILKKILKDESEAGREHLVNLTLTYFSHLRKEK